MYQVLLLTILFILTACGNTPDLQATRDTNTYNKILANKSEANIAKNEYKKLQASRKKV